MAANAGRYGTTCRDGAGMPKGDDCPLQLGDFFGFFRLGQILIAGQDLQKPQPEEDDRKETQGDDPEHGDAHRSASAGSVGRAVGQAEERHLIGHQNPPRLRLSLRRRRASIVGSLSTLWLLISARRRRRTGFGGCA